MTAIRYRVDDTMQELVTILTTAVRGAIYFRYALVRGEVAVSRESSVTT